MNILNIEINPRGKIFHSRYDIFRKLGGKIFYLTTKPEISPYLYFEGVKYLEDASIACLLEAVRQWDAEVKFDAIITTDEASVIATSLVCELLNLPGLSVKTALRSRNKYFMRQAHREYSAPHPKFSLCQSLEDAIKAAGQIGYPVIIKPSLGANSEHVYRIEDESMLKEYFPLAYNNNKKNSFIQNDLQDIDFLGPNEILIEEYLSGSEHCVEAYIYQGEVVIGSIADRINLELTTFDNDLYTTPTRLSEKQKHELREALCLGLKAQGIEHGVVHAEFRFHNEKIYIVEIAGRIGGGSLYKMSQHSYGYCPVSAAYNLALNQRYFYDKKTPQITAVGLTILSNNEGVIKKINVPLDICDQNIFNFEIVLSAGDKNLRPPLGNSILGFVGALGGSVADAIKTAEKCVSQIEVIIE